MIVQTGRLLKYRLIKYYMMVPVIQFSSFGIAFRITAL